MVQTIESIDITLFSEEKTMWGTFPDFFEPGNRAIKTFVRTFNIQNKYLPSLLRSRLLDVTQRSPKETLWGSVAWHPKDKKKQKKTFDKEAKLLAKVAWKKSLHSYNVAIAFKLYKMGEVT